MKDQKPKPNLKATVGRKPTTDPANFRYTVNFTEKDHARFLTLFEKSGFNSKSRFIAARVFNKEFVVITVDSSMMEFIAKVTNLHTQFRAIGVNINQITKVFQTRFSEKRAELMLQNMVQQVMELIKIHSQVLDLLRKIEEEKLPKNNKSTLK